ncbi:hypothetical protein CYMTET_18165, partial [Cymbomonas tetramitiformis]
MKKSFYTSWNSAKKKVKKAAKKYDPSRYRETSQSTPSGSATNGTRKSHGDVPSVFSGDSKESFGLNQHRINQAKAHHEEETREDVRANARKQLVQRGVVRLAEASSSHAFPALLRVLSVDLRGGDTARAADIEKAYKKALVQYHPDRNRSKGVENEVLAEETFKLLRAAHTNWQKYTPRDKSPPSRPSNRSKSEPRPRASPPSRKARGPQDAACSGHESKDDPIYPTARAEILRKAKEVLASSVPKPTTFPVQRPRAASLPTATAPPIRPSSSASPSPYTGEAANDVLPAGPRRGSGEDAPQARCKQADGGGAGTSGASTATTTGRKPGARGDMSRASEESAEPPSSHTGAEQERALEKAVQSAARASLRQQFDQYRANPAPHRLDSMLAIDPTALEGWGSMVLKASELQLPESADDDSWRSAIRLMSVFVEEVRDIRLMSVFVGE